MEEDCDIREASENMAVMHDGFYRRFGGLLSIQTGMKPAACFGFRLGGTGFRAGPRRAYAGVR